MEKRTLWKLNKDEISYSRIDVPINAKIVTSDYIIETPVGMFINPKYDEMVEQNDCYPLKKYYVSEEIYNEKYQEYLSQQTN